MYPIMEESYDLCVAIHRTCASDRTHKSYSRKEVYNNIEQKLAISLSIHAYFTLTFKHRAYVNRVGTQCLRLLHVRKKSVSDIPERHQHRMSVNHKHLAYRQMATDDEPVTRG